MTDSTTQETSSAPDLSNNKPVLITPITDGTSNSLQDAEQEVINKIHELLLDLFNKHKESGAAPNVIGNVAATVASNMLGFIFQRYNFGVPQMFTIISSIASAALAYVEQNVKKVL